MFIKKDNTRPITDVVNVSCNNCIMSWGYTDKEVYVEGFRQNIQSFPDVLVSLSDFEKFNDGAEVSIEDGFLVFKGEGEYKTPILPYCKLPTLDFVDCDSTLKIGKEYKRHKGFTEGLGVVYVTKGYAITTDSDVICATPSVLSKGFYQLNLFELAAELGDCTIYHQDLRYSLMSGDIVITVKEQNLVEFNQKFPIKLIESLLTLDFGNAIMIKATELKKKVKLFDSEEIEIGSNLKSETITEPLSDSFVTPIKVNTKTLKRVVGRLSGNVEISFINNLIKLADNKGFYIIGGN